MRPSPVERLQVTLVASVLAVTLNTAVGLSFGVFAAAFACLLWGHRRLHVAFPAMVLASMALTIFAVRACLLFLERRDGGRMSATAIAVLTTIAYWTPTYLRLAHDWEVPLGVPLVAVTGAAFIGTFWPVRAGAPSDSGETGS
jgi:hypothetical protein